MAYLFPILAVLIAFRFWHTEYKALSLVFAGDFVLLFGAAQAWIESSLPGGVWFLPNLGIIYILLFGAYLSVKSRAGNILAVLSAIVGLLHCANPILNIFTLDNYESIMTVYCILQFLAFFGGTSYELNHRNIPVSAWFNPRHHWNKGA